MSLAQPDSRWRLSPHGFLSSDAVVFVLFEDEIVGHAGDVIADDAGKRVFFGFFAVVVGESFGVLHPEGEEFADDKFCVVFFSGKV